MIRSKILDTQGRNEMGRKLALVASHPFLNTGLMLLDFHSLIRQDCSRHKFIKRVKGAAKARADAFRSLGGIPSTPVALDPFRCNHRSNAYLTETC